MRLRFKTTTRLANGWKSMTTIHEGETREIERHLAEKLVRDGAAVPDNVDSVSPRVSSGKKISKAKP